MEKIRSTLWVCVLFSFSLAGCLTDAPGSASESVYVSPAGSDLGSGSEAFPFRTIERAQVWVRERFNKPGHRTVYLRAGTYSLTKTLRFGPDDGGGNNGQVVYQSYPNERAVLSGGTPITGWSQSGSLSYAYVPGLYSRQLYSAAPEHDQPQPVRYPQSGYARLLGFQFVPGGCDGTLNPTANSHLDYVTVELTEALAPADVDALNSAELVILKAFTQSRLPISHIVAVGPRTLRVYPAGVSRKLEGCNFESQHEAGYRVYFERGWKFFANPAVFLPAPGSFVLANDSIYFYARPGDGVEAGGILVPHLETLVEVEGAENLAFRGLTFAHTNWSTPSWNGYIGGQAGMTGFCPEFVSQGFCRVPAMIEIHSAKGVAIERSSIYHAGAHGVRIQKSSRVGLLQNRLSNIAGNAIVAGSFSTDASLASAEILIENNVMRSIGRMYDGVGVLGGYLRDSRILRNSIYEVSYSGISLGWFGLGHLPASNTVVERNNIGYVNLLHSDGGGIYVMEGSKGTTVTANYIHHIEDTDSGFTSNTRHGIYLDHKASHVTVSDNQIESVPSGIFLQSQTGYEAQFNVVQKIWMENVPTPVYQSELISPTNTVEWFLGRQPSIIEDSGARL